MSGQSHSSSRKNSHPVASAAVSVVVFSMFGSVPSGLWLLRSLVNSLLAMSLWPMLMSAFADISWSRVQHWWNHGSPAVRQWLSNNRLSRAFFAQLYASCTSGGVFGVVAARLAAWVSLSFLCWSRVVQSCFACWIAVCLLPSKVIANPLVWSLPGL